MISPIMKSFSTATIAVFKARARAGTPKSAGRSGKVSRITSATGKALLRMVSLAVVKTVLTAGAPPMVPAVHAQRETEPEAPQSETSPSRRCRRPAQAHLYDAEGLLSQYSDEESGYLGDLSNDQDEGDSYAADDSVMALGSPSSVASPPFPPTPSAATVGSPVVVIARDAPILDFCAPVLSVCEFLEKEVSPPAREFGYVSASRFPIAPSPSLADVALDFKYNGPTVQLDVVGEFDLTPVNRHGSAFSDATIVVETSPQPSSSPARATKYPGVGVPSPANIVKMERGCDHFELVDLSMYKRFGQGADAIPPVRQALRLPPPPSVGVPAASKIVKMELAGDEFDLSWSKRRY